MRTWDKYERKGGLLIVFSGSSGVGKDVVLAELHKLDPNVRRCVTTTTRKPRKNEVDGVDYTFICEEEFRKRIADGDFLEYADVFGNLYGTPRKWVEDQLAQGIDIILKIDVQGGMTVKQQMPEAVMIFLAPPSLEELERRLCNRRTETEEEIAKRLTDARMELDQIPHYDYILENDIIEKAAQKLQAIIVAEHCKIINNEQ